MRSLAKLLALLALVVTPALAGTGSINVLDGGGVSRTYQIGTTGGGNYFGYFGLCDGTAAAQCVAIKAASTAAVATDPSLVVQMSPNSPALPVSISAPLGASTADTSSLAVTSGGTVGSGVTICSGAVGFQGWLSCIYSALTNPIVSQVSHGVNIGGVEGLAAAGATAAGYPVQAGGVYNSAAPTPSTGQVEPLQLDASANLKVAAQATTSAGPAGLIQADSSVAINISTATTTQLVALSSGKKIYVTSWDVVAGGTGAITLEYGTGSNCGTGTTVLTGAYALTAQTGIAKGMGLGPILVVPASNALCAVTSAATQMSGSLSYAQF